MGLVAFCASGLVCGFCWLPLFDVFEDFLHVVQLVAQLGELHVDLGGDLSRSLMWR
jgi:hypothetical protein